MNFLDSAQLHLNSVDKNSSIIINIYQQLAKQLNFKGIKLSPQKKTNYTILKENIKSMKIVFFGYEKNPFCIYTSEQNFEKYVGVLLILSVENFHC